MKAKQNISLLAGGEIGGIENSSNLIGLQSPSVILCNSGKISMGLIVPGG